MSDKRSHIALEWVSREIEETLNQAADALEGFVKNVDDITKLRFCLTYTHQVAGSLKMIELHGASLLSEEIEKVLSAMQKEEIVSQSASLCASELLKAIKVLVSYINEVNKSGEDNARQLLPSLNAVRALLPNQPQHEISEADLFNPNVSPALTAEHQAPDIATDEFNDLIRRLRQGFQKGLVGVVRSQDLEANYALLCKVCAALLKTSSNTASEPLWKIAFAITELLEKTALPAELESKKALSLLDKEMKNLEQGGPSALAELPEASLLKTLLYSVATATETTPLVDELSKLYNLNEALQPEVVSAKKPEKLLSQNRELMSGSREKLDEIKELFVECVAAQWDASLIRPVPRLLAALNKSFEATPFTALQPYLEAAQSFIETELLVRNDAPDWKIIESYADVISSLDYYLECFHAESEKKLTSILQGANESLQVLGCQTLSVGSIEEDQNSSNTMLTEHDEDEVDEEILEIFTEEAAEVIDNINAYLPKLIENHENLEALTELRRAYHTLKGSGRMVKAFTMGDFAWSIERMMNRVLDGEARVTENCLAVLQEATAYIPSMLSAFENKTAIDRYIVDSIIAKADDEWRGEKIAELDTLSPATSDEEPSDKGDDSVSIEASLETKFIVENSADDDIDEEILEIFTEEAAEVLENIQAYLPQLKQDPEDKDALAELRRAYHTLKGSGRMVKAFVMGDFAWSVERMLNKVVDGNAIVSDNFLQILDEATAYIPTILLAFETNSTVDRATVDAIVAKADSEFEGNAVEALVDSVDPLGLSLPAEQDIDDELILNDEVAIVTELDDVDPLGLNESSLSEDESLGDTESDDGLSVEHILQQEAPIETESAAEEDEIDEEILEIFTEEAAEVLENIKVYLPELQQDREHSLALAELRRAFHTLKGSGRMVKAFVMGDFAWSIERMLNKVVDGNATITENSLTIIADATDYVPTMMAAFESKAAIDRTIVDAIIARADSEWDGSAAVADTTDEITLVSETNELSDLESEDLSLDLSSAESLLDEEITFADEPALEQALTETDEIGLEAELSETAFEFDDSLDLSAITESLLAEEHVADDDAVAEDTDTTLGTDAIADERDAVAVEMDLEEEESSELAEIFAGEAQACIQEFVEYLDKIDPGFEDVEISADLQRTFHTLKGSAYMAGVSVMAELVSPIESLIRDLHNYQIKADAEILASFTQAAELLQQQLQQLRNGKLQHSDASLQFIEDANELHARRIATTGEVSEDNEGLTDNYSALLNEALECLTNASELLLRWRRNDVSSEERSELVGYVRRLSVTAATGNYTEVAELSCALADYYQYAAGTPATAFFDLADKAAEELDDMFDMIAAHQTVEAADDIVAVLQQASGIETKPAEQILAVEGSTLVTEEIPATMTATSGFAIDSELYKQQLAQADEETLEIFIEEANEIMDELDSHIHDWLEQHDDVSKLPEIMRSLHTLKGGARLAELSVLGDLTHEYESVVEKAERKAAYTEQFFEDVEQFQRQLQCLVDFSTSGNDSVFLALQQSEVAGLDVQASEDETVTVEAAETEQTADASITPSAVIDLAKLQQECAAADEETLEIFAEEAQELVSSLENSATAWLEDHSQVQETAELKRVLHTLKGGARLSELPSLGDLTHDYESMIEAAELTSQFDDGFFTQLKTYLDQVHQMVDCVLNLEASSGDSVTKLEPLSVEPLVEVTPIIESPVVAQLVPEITEANEVDEVLQLFLEEAVEQNEGIDECIAELQKDHSNDKPLEVIKRLLHTLKGGARLAEQARMGDLSHDFETYIINAERDNKQVDDAFVDALQSFNEQLNQNLEVLQKSFELPSDAATGNVVPIRPDVAKTSAQLTQAAIDATKNFIESFNQKQQQKRSAQEPVKVAPDLLDNLINLAGENSIGRSRVEEQVNDMAYSVDEMDVTVDRLHGQLRRLEIETEAQIVFRQEQVESEGIENFDPLEMDRYSQMQQLSKSLIESASDLDDISATFTNKMRDMETLLVQQGRINSELQEGLMRCQMVPFSRMVPRLRRIIRQIASELGKKVEFSVENAEGELDRTILERMIAPLEHMLRNAVDHGIEMPDARKQAGKAEKGKITLTLSRDGGEVVLTLTDNGAGVNLDAVKAKAIERGLMEADSELTDHEICQFILNAGFSTATKVTQISGRGVGMDVVHSEIKQMGGTLEIHSHAGQGSEFVVRLPFTVSVNRALMVTVGNDNYALPLNTIEGIVRVSPYELEAYYQPDAPMFEYAGQSYNLRYMGGLLQRGQKAKLEGLTMPLPVILIRSSEHTVAVQVDKLLGSQEVVVKTLGPQFSMVEGLNGATVLGDGSVVIILDMLALIRADASRVIDDMDALDIDAADAEVENTRVMVIDDSVTVRKVTSRLLERHGLDVILAKDGLDAVTQLQEMEVLPDVMLLDIEMPRMDGFEVVSRVRHNEKLAHIPICMITSRTGDKHRDRAISLGANEYLGKPFQERELLQTISRLTGVEVLQS